MKNVIILFVIMIGLVACLNLQAQTHNTVPAATPDGNNSSAPVNPAATVNPNGNIDHGNHQNPSDPTNSGTNTQLQQKFNTDETGYENLTPANIMDSQSSGTGAMIPDKKDSSNTGGAIPKQTSSRITNKKTKKPTH